jgi:hypothetical protein
MSPNGAWTIGKIPMIVLPDAAGFAMDAELDVAAWHEPRITDWWQQTDDSVCAMRGEVNDTLPVYLQEPNCDECDDPDTWNKYDAIDTVKACGRRDATDAGTSARCITSVKLCAAPAPETCRRQKSV